MPIDANTVRKIAALARLRIDPGEEGRYVSELASILTYVEQLQPLDVSSIEPTSTVVEGPPTPLRPDRIVPCEVREEALEQAPEREGDYFRVPRVV
ncbi:MAG TPA: Asp-tRNA(Asn)/Glu-tRNA(Gln) amidotransferase subunit GatC [Candidatus Eisenbacteria bacterium]